MKTEVIREDKVNEKKSMVYYNCYCGGDVSV